MQLHQAFFTSDGLLYEASAVLSVCRSAGPWLGGDLSCNGLTCQHILH